MPKPNKEEFDAAKAAFQQAKQDFEAAVTAAAEQVEAGTLDEAGFALIVQAELVELKAAKDAFVAAVKANHKPKRDKKPKPAPDAEPEPVAAV